MFLADSNIHEILFIKNVFLKDCMPDDDIFERQILEKLNIKSDIIDYIKLPTIFEGMDTWIKNTNIKCWYCDLNFNNYPIFIPRGIEKNSFKSARVYNIQTYGCFCSFCCAASFIKLNYSKICDYIKYIEMLKFLYKIFNNKNISDVLFAPDKYEMIHYGNKLSVEEYKGKIQEVINQMKTLEFF